MSTPADIEPLLQTARQQMRQRDFTRALATYQQVLKADARNASAHEGLATVAFLLQDYDRAIEHYKQQSALEPRQAQALVNLGAVYNRKHDYNNAAKMLRQALTRDRRCAEAYYNLGIAHRGLNQLSIAISAYKEAIRLSPEMAEAYQNLANVYVEMGNTQQAVLNYERALQINPNFTRARNGLEKARLAADQRKKAFSPFGRLVDVAEAERGAAAADYKELKPQQRYEDRREVHRLAKEAERAAAALLSHVRDELETSLRRMTHAFAQGDDYRALLPEYRTLHQAWIAFEDLQRQLAKPLEDLRAHEESLRV